MALKEKEGRDIREAIERFVRNLVRREISSAPYNQTKNGQVTKVTPHGYTVLIENKEYPNMLAINCANLVEGDVVVCAIPNGQMSQSYIVGKKVGLIQVSAGGGDVSDVEVNNVSVVSGGVANITLSAVAVSGSYDDLSNKPTIPTQTSDLTNDGDGASPFATQSFVNSSIATNTAYFRGTYNIVTDLGLTVSATEQEIVVALADEMTSQGIIPTNNDYCFVSYPDATDPTQFTKYDRYKYDGANSTWSYEYTLNNSSFTAAQWDAINSGISAGNYVTTVNGSSGAITVPVASISTTSGSESVTVDSNTLNVVTRNTAQSISGIKTFTNGIKLAPQSSIWNTSNIVTTNNDEVLGINTNGQVGFVANVTDSSVLANAFTFRNVSTNLFRIGTTNIRPESNNSYDCGTSTNRWRYVFAGTKMYTPAINALSFNLCVNDTSTVNATMQYNSTNQSIEFIFN